MLFLLVYALILILPNTKWRDRLPAKPSFYRYILVLFALNVLAGLGELQALFAPNPRSIYTDPDLYRAIPLLADFHTSHI